MFCADCGTSNTATAKFCYACGSRLVAASQSTPVPEAVNAVASVRAVILYARFGRRTLALIIDALVLNGLGFAVGFLIAFIAELLMDSFESSDLNGVLLVAGLTGG